MRKPTSIAQGRAPLDTHWGPHRIWLLPGAGWGGSGLSPSSALLQASPSGVASRGSKEEEKLYLDGGDEGSGEVGAKAGGQGQLADVLVLSQGAGNGLLAEQLQAGHPVLHAYHIQGRS